MSDLLKLKSEMTAVARDASSMANALGVLRKRLEGSVSTAQRVVQGTAQQQRYAQMISAYEQAARACDAAADALAQAGRTGTDIGQSL
jgi:hypothetical protein